MRRTRCVGRLPQQRRGVHIDQIADVLDRDIGRGVQARVDRVERVMTLAREHRRQTIAKDRFHCRQQPHFIVDHDVVARRMLALNLFEHLLLVNVDQHAAFHRIPQARTLNLAGLEHHVTVGENHRRAEPADFLEEGRVIGRFQANFAGRADVKFPRVHFSHSSQRLLTMDWVEGLRLREVVSSLSEKQKQRLVTLLVDVLLQMFVSDGLFHADLHPGNIFFHHDSTFTLLDFGMYGELTASQRDRFILYWFAVVQRQTRRAFHHFKAGTRRLPEANEEAFFARFEALAKKFYASRLSEMSFTKVYIEMMKAGYEYGFVFPNELMLHAKALTTAESLIFVLAPDARFEELSRPFIAREYAARTASLDLLKRRVSQLAPELLLLGEFLPPEAVDESWDWNATVELFNELRGQLDGVLQHSLERGGLWQMLVEPHARAVLKTTPLGESTGDLLKQTWDRYYELEPSIAIQPTLGAVFTTHLAVATLALHEVLLQYGTAAAESHRLIYDIGWRIYLQIGEIPLLVASAVTRDPHKRLKLATDLFRTFPFGAPGYEWRDVISADGSIAFDCTKCPVAEFFGKHDASELCVQTFCRLDFPLAEKWGGRLQRTGTIASGAALCDFRWKPREPTDSQLNGIEDTIE